MRFRKNIFVYAVVSLLVLVSASSYFRFMVQHDYVVSYEGECDPSVNSCFVECEDEECTTEYYYTVIERHATAVFNLCGEDITDCEEANTCLTGEADCYVNYCDPEIEETGSCYSEVTEL